MGLDPELHHLMKWSRFHDSYLSEIFELNQWILIIYLGDIAVKPAQAVKAYLGRGEGEFESSPSCQRF